MFNKLNKLTNYFQNAVKSSKNTMFRGTRRDDLESQWVALKKENPSATSKAHEIYRAAMIEACGVAKHSQQNYRDGRSAERGAKAFFNYLRQNTLNLNKDERRALHLLIVNKAKKKENHKALKFNGPYQILRVFKNSTQWEVFNSIYGQQDNKQDDKQYPLQNDKKNDEQYQLSQLLYKHLGDGISQSANPVADIVSYNQVQALKTKLNDLFSDEGKTEEERLRDKAEANKIYEGLRDHYGRYGSSAVNTEVILDMSIMKARINYLKQQEEEQLALDDQNEGVVAPANHLLKDKKIEHEQVALINTDIEEDQKDVISPGSTPFNDVEQVWMHPEGDEIIVSDDDEDENDGYSQTNDLDNDDADGYSQTTGLEKGDYDNPELHYDEAFVDDIDVDQQEKEGVANKYAAEMFTDHGNPTLFHTDDHSHQHKQNSKNDHLISDDHDYHNDVKI